MNGRNDTLDDGCSVWINEDRATNAATQDAGIFDFAAAPLWAPDEQGVPRPVYLTEKVERHYCQDLQVIIHF